MGMMQKLVQSAGDVGRVVRAGSYSVSGLRAAIRKEAAFRQEVILVTVLAPLGAWLGHDGIERLLLIGSLVLVLIVELLNSAVEATVDRISKKHHKLSGCAKDMGSAAVYLSILLAAHLGIDIVRSLNLPAIACYCSFIADNPNNGSCPPQPFLARRRHGGGRGSRFQQFSPAGRAA